MTADARLAIALLAMLMLGLCGIFLLIPDKRLAVACSAVWAGLVNVVFTVALPWEKEDKE